MEVKITLHRPSKVLIGKSTDVIKNLKKEIYNYDEDYISWICESIYEIERSGFKQNGYQNGGGAIIEYSF